MSKKTVPLELLPSYLAVIKNSVGSKLFRNRFYFINGKALDVLENGNLSCAYFVSSVLYHFGLTGQVHTTVVGTKEDLLKSGWLEINKPKIGSILIWESKYFSQSDSWHMHIGFYIGGGKAISTSSKAGTPIKHHWKKDDATGTKRKVLQILWHKALGD